MGSSILIPLVHKYSRWHRLVVTINLLSSRQQYLQASQLVCYGTYLWGLMKFFQSFLWWCFLMPFKSSLIQPLPLLHQTCCLLQLSPSQTWKEIPNSPMISRKKLMKENNATIPSLFGILVVLTWSFSFNFHYIHRVKNNYDTLEEEYFTSPVCLGMIAKHR